MATTSLFVEIIIIGLIGLVAGCLIFSGLMGIDLVRLMVDTSASKAVSSIFLAPLLAIAYTVGWPLNFIYKRIIHHSIRGGIREKYFPQDGTASYHHAKIFVSEHEGEALKSEFRFDRHIMRMTRSTCCGGVLLTVGFSSHSLYYFAIIAALLSVVSFFQARSRYVAFTKRLRDSYDYFVEKKNA